MASFRPPRARLTVLSLSAATFFMVSGGPYGLEDLVRAAGYGGAIAILLLLPLIWALPTGLMVGELAAAIPAEGGFYIWVRRALGPFWGFQEAWLSLASSIFDMAAYPAVFVGALGQLWPPAGHGFTRIWISATVILVCLAWNLKGAGAVGDGSTKLGLVLLAPFAVLTIASLFRGNVAAHASWPTPDTSDPLNWFDGVLVAMWNYMGWDNASTVAQEVEQPQRTYPRVMFWTLALITIVYVLPVLAGWRAGVPSAVWTTGAWVSIGAAVGGSWLGTVILVGTMISVLGMVNSLTMSYSRVPVALAEDGYAPRAFTKQLSSGAPWVSILACGLAWMLALGLSLERVLLLDILLYGFSLILEFVALAVLRRKEPDLIRPFRIPGGFLSTILVGVGPVGLLIAAFILDRDEKVGNFSAVGIAGVLMALGPLVYWAMNQKRKT